MKILGIDPGSVYMGLGCIEVKGNQYTCVGHELVRVKLKPSDSWALRLQRIYESIANKAFEWEPDCAAIEEVFVSKNIQSALKLGQARGAAIAAVAMNKMPLAEYSPRKIKQNLTSSGSADKQQVEKMVRMLLGRSLDSAGPIKRDDVTDALAIAICHAQHRVDL